MNHTESFNTQCSVLVIILLCPPDHKMSGALCHGLCGGVRKHSVNYRTNAWVDWSNFSVTHWGWLEEGSFQWSALPLIKDGHYGCHLGFGFRRLDNKRLGRFIRFSCGLLVMTSGRFLSMISSAAMAAILDLVSVHYLTNACWLVRFVGASLGIINLHHIPLLAKPYLPYTHRQRPNRGHMPRLALPLLNVLWQKFPPTLLHHPGKQRCLLNILFSFWSFTQSFHLASSISFIRPLHNLIFSCELFSWLVCRFDYNEP
jgi:hypothetical protein